MPTTEKTLMFLASFLANLASFIVICSVLGTQEWMSSAIAVSDSSSNGSIVITYGLFRGGSTQDGSAGLLEPDKEFEVLGVLKNSSQKTLHVLVIVFLVLSLLASLLSCAFTLYNSISNPYQTFLGPVGVYTWSGLSASLTFVTMMLFVGNIQAKHLSQELIEALYSSYPRSTHKGVTHHYGYSFWLMLLIILLNIVAVVIIIFYQRARYQRKQEQKKPMEYAPRDGILF
ncbi:clarin-3 [Equus asinus]|uniref:Clarin 3 n=1 Tax=Equus asinus TaxID=9793 RepID=A0A8C4PPV8_EQUAS|nr:clarin-3 [Equus asinus]